MLGNRARCASTSLAPDVVILDNAVLRVPTSETSEMSRVFFGSTASAAECVCSSLVFQFSGGFFVVFKHVVLSSYTRGFRGDTDAS